MCNCRYRSGGGKCPNQLTVNELRLFVRQLYALPCLLSQTPLLKVTWALGGRGSVWVHICPSFTPEAVCAKDGSWQGDGFRGSVRSGIWDSDIVEFRALFCVCL